MRKQYSNAEVKLVQEEKGLRYYEISGIRMKSVSNICNTLFPKFQKDQIVKRISEKEGLTSEEIIKTWDERRDQGTKLHNEIETFFKEGKYPEKNTKEFEQFLKFNSDMLSKGFNFKFCENIVFSLKFMISGTFDAMYFNEKTGEYILVDWKRTNKIRKENQFENSLEKCIRGFPNSNFWKYALQLNMYSVLCEHSKNIKPSSMILVNFNEKNESYEEFEIPKLDKVVNFLLKKRLKTL